MSINFWSFLSVLIVSGIFFAAFFIYLEHKKTMKKMELEMYKGRDDDLRNEMALLKNRVASLENSVSE